MTWTLNGKLLVGHATVTLGYFAFLTRDIVFFLILLVILSTYAGIFFAICTAYAVGLLAMEMGALTEDFSTGMATLWAEAATDFT